MRHKLGECLLQSGVIREDDLDRALAEQRRTGERLGVVLARLNLATEEQIAEAFASQLGFPYVDLQSDAPLPAAASFVPRDFAARHWCVPVALDNQVLTVAMADPLQFGVVQDLEARTGLRVRQAVAPLGQIAAAIESRYSDSPRAPAASAPHDDSSVVATRADEADAVALVLDDASEKGATEVHVEPAGDAVVVRHRVDGVLLEAMQLPRDTHEELLTRFKIASGMDVAEKLLPQSGRLRFTGADGLTTTYRAATLRTVGGESMILTVTPARGAPPPLDALALSPAALAEVRRMLDRRRGLVLVAGPHASGRTTTASAAAATAASRNLNAFSVERAAQFRIPAVSQTEVNEQIGLSPASALRSVLAQDPDLVLLDDVADEETATLMIRAAQRRQVVAVVDADDAVAAIESLADMGLDPARLASVLSGGIAQRLVRRLCAHCRQPRWDEIGGMPADDGAPSAFRAVGCDQCNHTGFRGQIGVFEAMRIGEPLRREIAGRRTGELRRKAVELGMATLLEDGLAKVRSGVTTPEELARAMGPVAEAEARALCEICGAAVAADFTACPYCGSRLGGSCRHCRRALQPQWRFCPYCARPV